jgi:transcriptional regulator with XRE-family HTH domain
MPSKKIYDQIRFNLKALRVNAGFSQEYLASKLKISQNAYSKQKLGQTKIDIITVIEIAKVFNIDFVTFMGMLMGEPIALLRQTALRCQ